jgi:hypothetical protein
MGAPEPTDGWTCPRCSWTNLSRDGQCVECGLAREDHGDDGLQVMDDPLELAGPSEAVRAAQGTSAHDNIKPGITTFPDAMDRGFVRANAPGDRPGRTGLVLALIGGVVLVAVLFFVLGR